MSDDAKNFKLHVENIIYNVLKKEHITKLDVKNLIEEMLRSKELTAKEVDAMKKAIKDSIDVIITNHERQLMGRVYKTVALMLSIFTIIFVIIQFILTIA
jgi:hypothetical protein